jgi:hypothetical protein
MPSLPVLGTIAKAALGGLSALGKKKARENDRPALAGPNPWEKPLPDASPDRTPAERAARRAWKWHYEVDEEEEDADTDAR